MSDDPITVPILYEFDELYIEVLEGDTNGSGIDLGGISLDGI